MTRSTPFRVAPRRAARRVRRLSNVRMVRPMRHVRQPAETRHRQKGIEFRASASQMRVAFARMAWNTGSSSPANELMTCSTSEVAVCCSRASSVHEHNSRSSIKAMKGRNGGPRNDIKEKIGPRVKVGKVNSDDFESGTPLDFLLGVMRDADSPPTLRLRVARKGSSAPA